jgi:hypothetical protein
MCAVRKFLTFVALFLGTAGLTIFAFDGYICHRYGCHMTEVAGIDADGTPVPWPTGDHPIFTRCPPFVYALGFCLAGAGVYASRMAVGRSSYSGRVCHGTE